MQNILLIGYMGVGKSTVGQLLAEQLAYSFIDIDQKIATDFGSSVATIFATVGESAFRQAEHQALQSLPAEKTVIATGGGIIQLKENHPLLKKSGKVVFLKAPLPLLYERVTQGQPTRPLVASQSYAEFVALYQTRVATYQALAEEVIEVHRLTPLEICQQIMEGMK